MNNLSLLREKFTIREIGIDTVPIIALGNRISITLPENSSPLIIRGHSMHMTLRFGAEILKQLSYVGHIENPSDYFKWSNIWKKLIKPFEKDHVSNTWIAVYFKGEPVFHDGYHHLFFDIIEQCEHKSQQGSEHYEQSIIMAQNAFKKMGKSVFIEQESHVGFVSDESNQELRFAIILRSPGQKSTFIVRLSEDKNIKKKPYEHIGMTLAADFIEAINMAVRIGFSEIAIKDKNLARTSSEMETFNSSTKRLASLNRSISQAEAQFKSRYRPERPDFETIQDQCKESILL